MLVDDVPDAYRDRPAVWRDKLDGIFEPKLTPAEQAEKARADAEADRRIMEQKWETWGESAEQLAAQEAFLAMAGEEG